VGGWLLKDLSDLSIYVTASLETRARRVAERDKKSFEEALREIISREQSMKKRFWEYYKVDINDLSVFDLVINTERIDIDLMIEISAIAVKNILLRR
jgi:cytidylate kinase